ncbi:hypothetical protein V6N13_088372 [Hibiscus sabdariffa]
MVVAFWNYNTSSSFSYSASSSKGRDLENNSDAFLVRVCVASERPMLTPPPPPPPPPPPLPPHLFLFKSNDGSRRNLFIFFTDRRPTEMIGECKKSFQSFEDECLLGLVMRFLDKFNEHSPKRVPSSLGISPVSLLAKRSMLETSSSNVVSYSSSLPFSTNVALT